MSAKKTNISHISKYLKQELDDHAMHVLEKEAQNDPFLMQAMEGFEQTATDPVAAMADLDERLARRIRRPEKRFIPYKIIAAAASVLVVLTIGGFWLYHQKAEITTATVATRADKTMVTRQADSLVITQPQPNSVAAAVKRYSKKPAAQPNLAASVNAAPVFKNDEVVGNSDVKAAVANSVTKLDTAMAFKSAASYGYSGDKLHEVKIRGVQPVTEQTLLSRVEGVNIDKPPAHAPTAEEIALKQQITGRVLSTTDLQPIPGASIKIDGKNTGTLTDAQGNFTITANKKDVLSVAVIGYQPQQLKVKDKDSLSILMKEDSRSLSEVVVVGYGAPTEVIAGAHPYNGWDNFKKYLKDNAISADKQTGTVRLSFHVNSDGSLSDFEIIKSLNDMADKQAIELIKQGPRWLANVDGKPEIVVIKIRFRQRK